MKKTNLHYVMLACAIIILILPTVKIYSQKSIGDPAVTFDNSRNDPKYPFMREWQKAGVEGGIPLRNTLPIKILLTPTDSEGIQDAIDDIETNGTPSVILLKKGTYSIDRPIHLKSNVILRGENKNEVLLEVTVRSRRDNDEQVFTFDDIQKSGLEDLTFEYIPPKSITLFDDRNVDLNRYCGSRCFSNDPAGEKNLYVSFVRMTRKSKNCWIDNCTFKNSGSDPLEIWGNHITCRNNTIDACYNKGGGGNGYYDIRGDYNLFAYEKVRRIRHFTIQQNAKYNVVTQCKIEVDVNFHNGDKGYNLVENNTITSLRWRSWAAFASGGSKYGHKKPGPNNIVFNNITRGRGNSERFSGDDKVFVFDQYSEPRLLRNQAPIGDTFYPVVLDGSDANNTGGDENEEEDCNNALVLKASEDAYLQGTARYNKRELRVEDSRRVSYLKFSFPSSTKQKVKSAKLELTVSSDSGNGLIEVYQGDSNNWKETTLSTTNKPNIKTKLGSLNTLYKLKKSYQWTLSNITPGKTISLIIKQKGGNDVSFSSKENTNPPKLILELECEKRFTQSLNLTIFPNPTSDFLTISGVKSGESIIVYDLSGKKRKSIIAVDEEERLELSELPSGQYMIKASGKSSLFIKE
ncbi:glycosyl hydrolase family 28-related protein [uncultured Aquimarina sp.]|uniref:CBM96 family carbohydrate-binding protein n=1 Tax=uncultured Aquimarina sp. TaxID=575652 RepID=UPI002603D527|nr:glycosyl hydrolase family 28-related protein [uncultured Aquimarina sp.]